MQWIDLLWTIPAILGIIISLFFLYKLNRRNRRNLIKIAFSMFLVSTVITNILHIIRFVYGDTQSLLLSRIMVSLGPLGPILFFLTGYIALKREMINWTIMIHFIPIFIIFILVWNPDMMYYSGNPKFGYGVDTFLFTANTVVMVGYMLGTPIIYYLLYKKYKEEFGQKLIFFIFGTVVGILTYAFASVTMGIIGNVPLISQTIPFTVALMFVMYGYLR